MVTAAAAPSPLLAIASAVAQAHWRRRPQNKSRAASPCLWQHACNRARAQQSLRWCKGLLSAQFSPAAAAAPSPPLATASAVAQAHWRRRPQNKSRVASPCLRQPACNGARAEQPLWWCKGLLSAKFLPAAAAAPSPSLATASAVAQQQNKSSSSLVIGSCIGFSTGLDCARCYHDGQRSRFGPLLDKVSSPRHRPVASDPPHEFEGGGHWDVSLAPLRVDHGRASGASPLRLSYLGTVPW